MKNVGPLLPTNEILYIATDEKNLTFFQPFLQSGKFSKIFYLQDFKTLANLTEVNPNYLGNSCEIYSRYCDLISH